MSEESRTGSRPVTKEVRARAVKREIINSTSDVHFTSGMKRHLLDASEPHAPLVSAAAWVLLLVTVSAVLVLLIWLGEVIS